MPASNFKFVSPGVFIQEIDNSFRPARAAAIGPVVIGRATRGLAMQPVTVESYSEFVEMFGDTVPGAGGGDIYRDGNFQSPMYGTYAAKAFLNANVAPLTYVRLLGQETTTGNSAASSTPAAAAGWRTDQIQVLTSSTTAGGAFGLFIAPSASNGVYTGNSAFELASIIYVQSGSVQLAGDLAGGDLTVCFNQVTASSAVIDSDANGVFTMVINGATNGEKVFNVSMDEDNKYYIRNMLNTNPQLASTRGTFYPNSSYEDYWLGESYEQEMRDLFSDEFTKCVGVIAGIASGSLKDNGPHNMKGVASQEAVAGWFIGQDLGTSTSYDPKNAKKLFRLLGRGHGEWLHKNVKVTISDIRQSSTTTDPYGSFSVVLRQIDDKDTSPVELERFDNCSLNPASPNYVSKLIGDKFFKWDASTKELRPYGDYDNKSRYIRVQMSDEVEAGAVESTLLPFGYYGPPRFKSVIAQEAIPAAGYHVLGRGATGSYVMLGSGLPGYSRQDTATGVVLSSSFGSLCTASFNFPSVRLRSNSSHNGITNPKKACWGFDVYRLADTSETAIQSGIYDTHRLLTPALASTTGIPTDFTSLSLQGIDNYSYIFTLDNITGAASPYTYSSGSRTAGNSHTAVNGYTELLDNVANKFTAPFFGGFDGFDITKPDPMRNGEMGDSSTEDNSYVYHTYTRAIETVADPDFINMNLMAVPGLTLKGLTSKMINTCEGRADALALIDLPDVYKPSHEEYNSDKTSRIGTTPTAAANALKNRRIDSSYGATFYPWVQTVDANTNQTLWVPPTVAMMGVLGSSEAASAIWFAPAGFNRGGLTDGAAGIPVANVSERLSSSDRDTLYEARINPIASFPSEGIVVFGQKTLQERSSALDRINVRRLVIYLKKQISIRSSQILFEQNIQATWNKFKALIDPILSNTQIGGGITDYRLYLDETTTTADLIDQNVLYAKIMVKPARAIEYIAIDFVIASTGASFDD